MPFFIFFFQCIMHHPRIGLEYTKAGSKGILLHQFVVFTHIYESLFIDVSVYLFTATFYFQTTKQLCSYEKKAISLFYVYG